MSDWQQRQIENLRQQKLAQALMEGGAEPISAGQMAGGVYIPNYAGILGQALASGVGGYRSRQLADEAQQISAERQAAQDEWINSAPSNTSDYQARLSHALRGQQFMPDASKVMLQALSQRPRLRTINDGKTMSVIDDEGNTVYSAPMQLTPAGEAANMRHQTPSASTVYSNEQQNARQSRGFQNQDSRITQQRHPYAYQNASGENVVGSVDARGNIFAPDGTVIQFGSRPPPGQGPESAPAPAPAPAPEGRINRRQELVNGPSIEGLRRTLDSAQQQLDAAITRGDRKQADVSQMEVRRLSSEISRRELGQTPAPTPAPAAPAPAAPAPMQGAPGVPTVRPVKKETAEGKSMSPALGKSYVENNTAISQIDAAINALSMNKNAVGVKGYMPDAVLQRVDKEGVNARSRIADIGSLRIHDRSGAAVTLTELERLKPFIPSVTDDAATAETKLKNLREAYMQMQTEIQDFAQSQGWRSPDSAARRAGAQGTEESAAASLPGKSDVNYGALYGF
jgi:cell division protein FtsL